MIEESKIPVAKEAKLSLIEESNSKFLSPSEFKYLLKSFFSQNRLLYSGDIICLQFNQEEKIYYEISFLNSTDSAGEKIPYFVNQTTSIYQIPKKRGFFPRQSFDFQKEFLPKRYFEIEERMRNLFSIKFEKSSEVISSPLISILASTEGNRSEKLIEVLVDELGVDLVKIDCMDFWNIEGRNIDKVLDAAIERG